MKNLINVVVIVCLIFCASTPAQVLINKEYLQWIKGEFEVPAEIKMQRKVDGLQPFLDSKSEFTRMAAVRRLAEIEGPNSIGLLLEVFRKEPVPKGLHDVPLVKLEAIRRLGTIGTEQAKSALLGILKDYWQRGSNIKDDNSSRVDHRDFRTMIPLLIKTLDRWGEDKDVFKIVETIAFSDDVKEFYTYPNDIGQRAWEVYLKGTMIRQGILEEKDSAIYLLNFIEDIEKPIAYRTLKSVKKRAAIAILHQHSDSNLSALIKEFNDQIKKEPRDSKGFLTERHNILRRKKGTINKILKEKKEKEEKAIKKEAK